MQHYTYIRKFLCVSFGLLLGMVIAESLHVSEIYAQEGAGDGSATESGDALGTKKIESHVKNMQKAIQDAIEKLDVVSEVSHEERIQRLENFLTVAKNSLTGLSDGGELFDALEEAVGKTEEARQEAKKRSSDPEIPARIRDKYAAVERELAESKDDLYDKKILIDNQRGKLEVTIKEWEAEKDYYAYLIMLDEIAQANEALIEVINSAKGLNDSINSFAVDMGFESEEEAETQPE